MKSQLTPKISDSTFKLLQALRAIQEARGLYFSYYCDSFGEDLADKMMRQPEDVFEAAEAMIEGKILEDIRYWAQCVEAPSEI